MSTARIAQRSATGKGGRRRHGMQDAERRGRDHQGVGACDREGVHLAGGAGACAPTDADASLSSAALPPRPMGRRATRGFAAVVAVTAADTAEQAAIAPFGQPVAANAITIGPLP